MQKFPLTQLALLCSIYLTQMTMTVEAAELENRKEQEQNKLSNNQKEKQFEVISIFGQRNQLETATGSAVVLGEKTLEQFEFDDIHRVLQSVPGVYIREEDGYGLRPNIGLRGATTERSSKVAIMEDGILIAPAPYAAPAAYYFPLMSRMSQVEVFKGPSAIKYGPNTVGGAINMLSRPINSAKNPLAKIDLALGQDNYQKAHSYFSQTKTLTGYGDVGLLIEGLTINSDGFKVLDGGGDTGFKKNEIILKLNFVPSSAQYYQIWQFKGGYSDEVSNETYLGLTDTDFIKNAERRYTASKKDKMDWEHYQFQLSYYIELDDQTSFYTQAYHREFDRDWDRLDSFNSSRSMQTILTSPETGINALFMEVLKGERDSVNSQENLLFTLNDRRYYSQGLETKLLWDSELMGADLTLDAGFRLHQDEVERNHRADQYFMQGGELFFANEQQQTTTQNKDSATALASYVNANVDFGEFNITAGLRVEYIEGESDDYLTGKKLTSSDTVVMPGFGIFYKIDEILGLLLGVNKGYVPNSPGQGDSVDPEESWNYEFGLRYNQQALRAEVIGFYNDYSNLKGTCTFSSGCDQTLDEEFNAGEVNVYGLEASFTAEFEPTKELTIPVNVAYTRTESEFQNSFQSNFSQWGRVKSGDSLPYLPKNQISIEVALQHENWRVALLLKHVEAMQEAAGDSTELSGLWTDELQQLDFSSWYRLSDHVKAYLKVDNLTDETTIVSRRPFGARPGKPRQATIGMKFTF